MAKILPLNQSFSEDERGRICYINKRLERVLPALPLDLLTIKTNLIGVRMILSDSGEINPLELYFELCQEIRAKIDQDCSLDQELREICSLRDSLEILILTKGAAA